MKYSIWFKNCTSDSEYNSNAYFRVLFAQITTSVSQVNSIHTQSQIGISTQNGISNSGAYFTCNILVIGIQDLYISKYKYTIRAVISTLICMSKTSNSMSNSECYLAVRIHVRVLLLP